MSQRLPLRLCPALCTRARSFSLPLGRSRFYRAPVLIIRALHAYLLIWPAESSARLYRGLFPFPLMLLSGGRPLARPRARASACTQRYARIHHPVDSVPNGRFGLGHVPSPSIVSSLLTRGFPRLESRFFSPRCSQNAPCTSERGYRRAGRDGKRYSLPPRDASSSDGIAVPRPRRSRRDRARTYFFSPSRRSR